MIAPLSHLLAININYIIRDVIKAFISLCVLLNVICKPMLSGYFQFTAWGKFEIYHLLYMYSSEMHSIAWGVIFMHHALTEYLSNFKLRKILEIVVWLVLSGLCLLPDTLEEKEADMCRSRNEWLLCCILSFFRTLETQLCEYSLHWTIW